MKRKQIALVMYSIGISGGTNVIFNHCNRLDFANADLTVVTIRNDELALANWHPMFRNKRISWCHIDDTIGKHFDLAIFTYFETIYVANRINADRCVYFIQSIESRFFQRRGIDASRAEITYSLDLGMVTVASWISDYLKRVHGKAPVVVRNGINKRLFSPDGPTIVSRGERLRVLVEGAIAAPFKNVRETLEILRGLGNAEIWLLTPDPDVDSDVAHRIFGRVPISVVPAILRSCDVLVKLSSVEGMFGPPLEMFHCGGTAVTSDVTGHEEYMRHGENGFVVPLAELERTRSYVELLAGSSAARTALQEGARATAAAWPSSAEAAGEFWRAIEAVSEQAPVGSDEIARRLRPFRLLLRGWVRDRRALPSPAAPAHGLSDQLNGLCAAVRRGEWGTVGAEMASLRRSFATVGLVPDDVVGLANVVRQNYAAGNPLAPLAWRLVEYIYAFGICALEREINFNVAATWLYVAYELSLTYVETTGGAPPSGWVLPLANLGCARADLGAGRHGAVRELVEALWAQGAGRPVIADLEGYDNALRQSTTLIRELADLGGAEETVLLACRLILISGGPAFSDARCRIALDLLEILRGTGTSGQDTESGTTRATHDAPAPGPRAAGFVQAVHEGMGQPVFDMMPPALRAQCLAAVEATPPLALHRLSRVIAASYANAAASVIAASG